ncbi:MAG: pseudaminic acid synthase [Candidatus Magasanikbacteria bacterium]|nr:pseudaminic acid synthase [Candidatus Magasanikbacteria bacterium]
MEEIIIHTPKGERKIGPGNPVFIIAEMSGNHNQDIQRAYKIIDAAVEAGVDAIKLQTYTPDTLTIDCDNDFFKVKVNDVWKGKTLYELYKEAYTPWEWQAQLKSYGESKGVLVFSTPFDESSVDFLETLNVELYKVASFEMVDLELLKKIGSTKKPVIISRGLGSKEEISLSVKTLKVAGAPQVAVLHCVSSYPAEVDQMNLATIPDIIKNFNVIAGLSDHSLGITAAVTSVALGANIIEKHFTLSRKDGGSDSAFSLEPNEMRELVATVREVEKAIGVPTYLAGAKEKENLVFRRSLFVVEDVKVGEVFTSKNIRCIRPGYGLQPRYLHDVIGKKSTQDISRGTPLNLDMVG